MVTECTYDRWTGFKTDLFFGESEFCSTPPKKPIADSSRFPSATIRYSVLGLAYYFFIVYKYIFAIRFFPARRRSFYSGFFGPTDLGPIKKNKIHCNIIQKEKKRIRENLLDQTNHSRRLEWILFL